MCEIMYETVCEAMYETMYETICELVTLTANIQPEPVHCMYR